MHFEFAAPARIIFGPGRLADAGTLARELGSRALVVTGRNPQRAARLLDRLAAAQVAATVFSVAGEPSTDDITRGTAHARAHGCDCVIGFGGGSAIDAAKAVGVLLANGGDLLDYLEVIGRAQPLPRPGAPCLAIPTTAGTGAEVTRNAVLFSPPHRVKVSLRGPHVLPRIALVDPELTHGLPPAVTASTGLDALTQLIEPYTSCRAQPFTDALCVDGLRRAARSLRRAFDHGGDAAARADLSLASLFGGLALANAGLGAVHGFAGPLGGMFPAPHGAVCAALLPHVMRANLAALPARGDAGHERLRRYDEVARLLTGRGDATGLEGVRWVEALVTDLRIPPLSSYGVTVADFPELIQASSKASSMKANPVPLSPAELEAILRRAL
jgi:alcohol dehydrogenase class IV